MGRAPPQIGLWPVALGAHALENLARAHVEKLNLDVFMFCLVPRNEVVLTLTGLTGPLPAAAAVVTMLATMGLPSYDLVFTARVWRWAFLAGAILFGLFGMAVVAYLMMAYATQHESFGVPFIGERGTRLAPLHPPAGGQQRKERGL
jgi:hypothetical protein